MAKKEKAYEIGEQAAPFGIFTCEEVLANHKGFALDNSMEQNYKLLLHQFPKELGPLGDSLSDQQKAAVQIMFRFLSSATGALLQPEDVYKVYDLTAATSGTMFQLAVKQNKYIDFNYRDAVRS